MNINISEIIENKLAQMEKDRVIETKIEQAIEKNINAAIDDVLGGYTLRNELEKALKETVNSIAGSIGLSSYNGMIAQLVKDLLAQYVKQDMSDKISESVKGILFKVPDKQPIALSDLIKKYQDYLNGYTEEPDKCERNEHDGYTIEFVTDKSIWSQSQHVKLYLDEEYKTDKHDDHDIVIDFGYIKDGDKTVKIKHLYFNGDDMEKKWNINYLSKIEVLLLNLYWNHAEIVYDIENYDEDDHYYETDSDY